jgi:uncharacterized damage-inducible protein DinB
VNVEATYEGWQRVQTQLMNRLPSLGLRELRLKGSADAWPIWAIVSHIAVVRVYWLCEFCKEPGAETTPFADPGEGWEDHLDVPRRSEELAFAVESSWQIVQSCLARWTPEMLGETFDRVREGNVQHHTRSSVLTRLVMHDSFHCGEVSLLLGMRGLPSLDPWSPPA